VRDVLGLYLNLPDRALVLWVDKKPQIQAVDGTAPVLPMPSRAPQPRLHADLPRRNLNCSRYLTSYVLRQSPHYPSSAITTAIELCQLKVGYWPNRYSTFSFVFMAQATAL
jgi:hypothetical protein